MVLTICWKKFIRILLCMSDHSTYKKLFFYMLWLPVHCVWENTERYDDTPCVIFVSTTRHYVSCSTENSRQKINDTKNYVITYRKLQPGKLINKNNSLLILYRRCLHKKSTQSIDYASEKINGVRNRSRLNIIHMRIILVYVFV